MCIRDRNSTAWSASGGSGRRRIGGVASGACRGGATRGTMEGVAILKHEVWICGEGLPGCCLAGPDGDVARRAFAESGCRLEHVELVGLALDERDAPFLGEGEPHALSLIHI